MRLALITGWLLLAMSGTAAGQSRPHPGTAPAKFSLEGDWRVNFILPMEASATAPGLVAPEADQKRLAEALGQEMAADFVKDLDPEFPALVTQSDGLAIVRGQRRTRALIAPADGKLPYTDAARRDLNGPSPSRSKDNPEQRPNAERCLVGSGQPPLSTFTLDSHIQILRTPDHVVIHVEYGDDVRIVPITGTHGPKVAWGRLGDSIGRWEGSTLVIETVGLPDADRFHNPPMLLVPGESTVIERMTPISDQELLYQFTVVAAKTYAAPWLGEFSWYRTDKRMFEHACHEGNYSLPNILSGARYEESLARTATAPAP